MQGLILPVIGIALSSFSIGMTAGKLLYSWQEEAKKRYEQSNERND